MREARAAARINSRAAVTVYDVVDEEGKPWIVMERLAATTLADVLRREGALPADRVASIGLRVLEALIAAHAAGVLHRDVKPSNVMITTDGEAVLTDFGIASLEGDPTLTTTGMLIGSPAYMAPERARGGPASPAGDLWSLGCTLYTAAEGRGPFAKEGPLATLTAVITDEPFPPVRSGALAPVLLALLAKDPADRPDAATTARMLTEAERAGAPAVAAPVRGRGPSEEVERTRPFHAAVPPTQAAPDAAAPATDHEPPATAPPYSAAPAAAVPPTSAAAQPRSAAKARHRRTDRVPPRSRPRRAGAMVIALVGLVVLAAAALGPGWFNGDPEMAASSPEATPPMPAASQPPSAAASTPVESAAAPEQPARPAPPQAAPGQGVTLPAGFEHYEDPTGFAVAIPAGWVVAKERSSTFVREPGGRRYLQVDQTREPKSDPAADWRQQEPRVSQRLAGYERIRIDPLDYRGWEAADWEFTWRAEGDPRRVLNRGFITAPDRAYALYWSVPAEQWEDALDDYEVFAATFRPAT
jgi:hypothetical protein